MIFFIPVSAGLLLLFNSCKSSFQRPKEISHVVTIADTAGYSVAVDSIVIPIDTSYSPMYLVAHTYRTPQNNVVFVGYNKSRHALDLISLTEKRPVGSIQLYKSGSYAFGNLQALFVHSIDSIFIIDSYYVGLVDSTGLLRKRWPINSRAKKDDSFFNNYSFFLKAPNIFYFNRFTNDLYIQTVKTAYLSDVNMGILTDGDDQFIAKFNIRTGEKHLLPLVYPGSYRSNYFGSIAQPAVNFQIKSSSDISMNYVFPISSAVYSYSYDSNVVNRYVCNSSLTKNAPEPLERTLADNEEARAKHFHNNINFCSVVTADNNFIYRFHYGELPKEVTDYSKVYLIKKLVLSVLDEQFSLVKETTVVPNTVMPLMAFPYESGIALPLLNPATPDKSSFKLLTLNTRNHG